MNMEERIRPILTYFAFVLLWSCHQSSVGHEISDNSWQQQSSSIVSRISNLLQSKYQADVTVLVGSNVSDRKEFQVHKLILSMSSPVFADLLANGTDKTFYLTDMSPHIFEIILDYIYRDEVNIDSLNDTFDIWRAACDYQLTHLVQATESTIDSHASYLINTSEFIHLPENIVAKILQRPMLNAPEVAIFEALLSWARSSLSKAKLPSSSLNLQSKLKNLLHLVDLEAMTAEEFVTTVTPSGVVPQDDLNSLLINLLKKILEDGTCTALSSFNSAPRFQRREVSCDRSSTEDQVGYLLKSGPTDHYLKFEVECPTPCYLSGVQVTPHFFRTSGQPMTLTALLTIWDQDGSKMLWDVRSLRPPYLFRLYNPIPLQSGQTYVLQLWTGKFSTYSASGTYDLPGMQVCVKCQTRLTCGKGLRVHFSSDPRSEFTSESSGIVSSLKIYV